MKVEQHKNGVTHIGSQHPDGTVAYALLAQALGTTDADFITAIIEISWEMLGARISHASEENLDFRALRIGRSSSLPATEWRPCSPPRWPWCTSLR